MVTKTLLVPFAFVLFSVHALEIDPYQKGPYEVRKNLLMLFAIKTFKQVDFTSIKPDFLGLQLDHHLDVFSPRASGSFPVIVFFSGMSCTTPASYYSTILTHVSAYT